MTYNQDFFCGYSPERINPGDTQHRLPDIVKVTSGSTSEAASFVDGLYQLIIRAGTFKAGSIRVAEAAKVIENTQRDVNIALINELAIIFNRLGIDTMEVLESAGTKWNLAGRRLNDDMGRYVASQVIKLMLKKRIHVAGSHILVLGLTFKENCPDLRYTAVINIVRELDSYGAEVEVFDPWVDQDEAEALYSIRMVEYPARERYEAVVAAVAHREIITLDPAVLRSFCREQTVVYDVKHALQEGLADTSL
jgi:UDP-N-acetyl-D-galactosamine dehydrogenase